MIRGDELTIRGCGFLPDSIEQSAKGDLSLPPSPLVVFVLLHYIVLFWIILVLQLLVIYIHI